MDAIDCQKTVIVSAPTSSGKTFASFYAFKSVLATDSNSIAIYVAPTKALVNQMLAGVYARFKCHEPGLNKKLIGVFTRDHIQHVSNCRILLTVPECLEILYFAPQAKSMIKNVKYIIFDEFQMINDEERGKVWERIVLMCECPFLALSATIDNPRMLRDWLASAKSQSNIGSRIFFNAHVDDVLELFNNNNLKQDFDANEFAVFEAALVSISSVFASLKKYENLDGKLKKIKAVLVELDDKERCSISNKLKLFLNDVILIDFKQSPTDFVYYTYNYDGPNNLEENSYVLK